MDARRGRSQSPGRAAAASTNKNIYGNSAHSRQILGGGGGKTAKPPFTPSANRPGSLGSLQVTPRSKSKDRASQHSRQSQSRSSPTTAASTPPSNHSRESLDGDGAPPRLPARPGRSMSPTNRNVGPRGRSTSRGSGPGSRGRSTERPKSMDLGPAGGMRNIAPSRGRSTERPRSTDFSGHVRGTSRERSGPAGPRGRSMDRSTHNKSGGPSGRSMDHSTHSMGGPRGRSMGRSGHSMDGRPRGRSTDRSGHSRDRSMDRHSGHSRDSFDRRPSLDDAYMSGKDSKMNRSFLGNVDRDNIPWRKVCSYLIPTCVLVVCSVGLIISTGNASKFTPPAFKDQRVQNEDLTDPFQGNSGIPTWETGGTGLAVTIINALSDDWRTAFSLATADWDFGEPDAIDLYPEDTSYQFSCDQEDGKIKVCNGDYGDTKWRGICEVTAEGGKLTSASARMNDFYLSIMDAGAWQYTMCHELGHALGLGHTDENFNNPDLGNCLDYTDNLDKNKHPDEGNFESLLELYGPAPGDQQRQLRGGAERRSSRWHNNSHHTHTRATKHLPDHIHEKRKQVIQKLLERRDDNAHEDGWKLIHRKKHGEAHEMDLGDGFKVQVHMLLAQNR